MENWEKELHVARIVAGEEEVPTSMGVFTLGTPSRSARLRAAVVYRDTWQRCHLEGVLTDAEVMVLMQERRLWMPEDEEGRAAMAEKIDDLKVGLYEMASRSNERASIRHLLRRLREEMATLEGRKHRFDHLTCEGIASASRYRCLAGFSLRREGGEPYWSSPAGWEEPDGAIDEVLEHVARGRLDEGGFREVARTEPWRSIWQSRSHAGRGVFDAAAVDLSHDQAYLAAWSSMYSAVHESHDSPDEDITSDDDMFDGWLLLRKRERDAQRARKIGDEIGNEKIRNSQEVFILADTIEDARKIERLNAGAAAMIKKQRMDYLRGRGTVAESEMPDTAMRIQGEMARIAASKAKGGA